MFFSLFGRAEVSNKGGEGIEPRAKGHSVSLSSVNGKGVHLFRRTQLTNSFSPAV